MCREYPCMIGGISAIGLIQSVLWFALSVVTFLVYTCILPVVEYKDKTDFFAVTLVKLYFEGPHCIPDGSYLGKFNEDYTNRAVINLLGRDVVFFVMIAYLILNAIYFILSLGLYRKRQQESKRLYALFWSLVTLILCALDALLTYAFFIDSFTLMYYINNSSKIETFLGGIPYIPLILAFISSRFVVVWLWNFFAGIYILFISIPLCVVRERTDPVKEEPVKVTVERMKEKPEEKPEEKREEAKPEGDRESSISLIQANFKSKLDVRSHPDYTDLRRTMEAVTRFPSDERLSRDGQNQSWCYAPSEASCAKSLSHKDWGATNEGYVNDEQIVGESDFDHNLKNFESGQKKVKKTKPPIGKPVEPVRR